MPGQQQYFAPGFCSDTTVGVLGVGLSSALAFRMQHRVLIHYLNQHKVFQ